MVSRWRDRLAFTAYMKSPAHKASHARIDPALKQDISLRRLEHLHGVAEQEPVALTATGDPHPDPLPRQRVPDENELHGQLIRRYRRIASVENTTVMATSQPMLMSAGRSVGPPLTRARTASTVGVTGVCRAKSFTRRKSPRSPEASTPTVTSAHQG